MRPADRPELRLAVACGRAAAHAEFCGEHGLAAGLAEIARVLAATAGEPEMLSEHPPMLREQSDPPARRG